MKKFILLISLFALSMDYGTPSESYANNVSTNYELEFTPINVYNYIKKVGIKNPDVVFSQCILETGHFSSPVFEQNHNLFGMREAKIRPTTATGTNLKHATYDNWMKSVDDYKLWQDNHDLSKIKTDKQYLNFLGSCGYAEAKKYKQTLKIMLDKFVPKYLESNEYWEARVEKGTSINVNA